MENSDTLELTKFIEKAPGYKEALHFAPLARGIEIFAIIGILDGYVKSRGLSKSEVVIAEIMAGNGYLSQFLVKAGYKRIHSLEASNHMANDSYLNDRYIQLHAIESIYSIGDILKSIKPNVVISIAGFHHMLEYNNKGVNADKSIKKQKKVVDICMRNIEKNGMVVIADIRDDDLDDIIDEEPEYWSTRSFNKIYSGKDQLIPIDCRNRILKTKDISEYSKTVTDCLMPPLQIGKNPTTRWFHEVIDKETSVGHKDIPIGRKFIDSLKETYKVNFAKINSPWLFTNIIEFRSFITSFWFTELINNKKKMDGIFQMAESINGIRNLENTERLSFGWNLAILTIQSNEQEVPSLFYPNIVVLLSSIIVVSLAGIVIKANTTIYLLIKIISNVLIFLTGVTAKEIYDKFKRK